MIMSRDDGILRVGPEDAGELLDLLKTFTEEVLPEEDSGALRSGYAKFIALEGPQGRLVSYVLRRAGKPVGCVQLFRYSHPPMLDEPASYVEGELLNLYVLPAERRKGCGQALLDRLFEDARKEGLRCIRLNSSPEAEGLYEKNGFKAPPFKVYAKWIKP
jgi:ribosomal protein S18 acetylase RimI-like enzyme